MKDDDSRALSVLVGQECWAIAAGPGTGSMIQLFLGKKLRRSQPLPNDKLSPEIRENDAEFRVCIFYCSWRLLSPEGIVCSSAWSSNEEDGPMLKGLANVKQQRVVSIHLTPITRDLSMRFENGFELSVFNDYISEGMGDNAYWIATPEARYSIRGFNFAVSDR